MVTMKADRIVKNVPKAWRMSRDLAKERNFAAFFILSQL
jgi:hypothetical protein